MVDEATKFLTNPASRVGTMTVAPDISLLVAFITLAGVIIGALISAFISKLISGRALYIN